MFRILAVNPGSTSTKVAFYEDENEIWNRTVTYSRERLAQFGKIVDQLPMR
ncbi:MAG TPA: butyrate kinase, partial [bacterium]|nr:butyrate kinase [bacterium]